MNRLVSIFVFALALTCTAALIYMTRYVFGFRRKDCLYITGKLSKTAIKKQVFRGHPFTGKWHKYWTAYTYMYHVDGKAYEVNGGVHGKGKDLPHTVTVCAQKKAPGYGYIPQFEKAPSFLIPVFLLAGCVLLYAAAFGLWFL